jgi:hydrogenase-4 transcriptional activator
MSRNLQVELEVGREACQPVEIGEAVDRIAARLKSRLPLSLILVRRFDVTRRRLETVAAWAAGNVRPPDRTRTECAAEEMGPVLDWCHTGHVRMGVAGGDDAIVRLLVPEGLTGVVLVGPLGDEEGPIGVLVLVARQGTIFEAEHEELARVLLEPFRVALDHDLRFHELARLREAVEADNRALLSRLGRQEIVETVVGAEEGLRSVMERVEQVAHTDAPVLILGETGSGKEVVARAIHQRSRRSAGPVVRVNCGAIPPELVDSELFGHERGSFTGAIATHKGWFERADGGTLFLDEVAELPLAAQVRLLRILQDGSFERVGAQRALTVDVRIVAATHRDMAQLVAEGRFREDLWYRISVFPIRLPPLRERNEDIPQLAAHFAWKAGKRLGAGPLVPSPEDVELLLAYDWPGNVRELASVIERAAILGNGRQLMVAAALGTSTATRRGPPAGATMSSRVAAAQQTSAWPSSPSFGQPPPSPAYGQAPQSWSQPPQPAWYAAPPPSQPPLPSLDEAMVQHINEALAATYGRIEGPFGAAARLKINPHTLRARMRKLGIDWQKYRVHGRE